MLRTLFIIFLSVVALINMFGLFITIPGFIFYDGDLLDICYCAIGLIASIYLLTKVDLGDR